MDVFEAVASRCSCRAFLPTPVPHIIIREIVERAARAPSAGNMQPWRVYAIAGQRVGQLKALQRCLRHAWRQTCRKARAPTTRFIPNR
jgi:nitroreductase